jgi:hypothetical protein
VQQDAAIDCDVDRSDRRRHIVHGAIDRLGARIEGAVTEPVAIVDAADVIAAASFDGGRVAARERDYVSGLILGQII